MLRKNLPLQKHKGMSIYCNSCKRSFSWTTRIVSKQGETAKAEEPLCNKSKNLFSDCPFFKQHRYKIRIFIPGEKGKTKTKNLDAFEYKKAVLEAQDFENKIRSKKEIAQIKSKGHRNYNILLIDAQIEYSKIPFKYRPPRTSTNQKNKKTLKRNSIFHRTI